MEMSHTSANQDRLGSTLLFLFGLLAIGVGLAVGMLVDPLGFIGLVVGAIALVVARRFVPGRTGTISPPDPAAHADADLLAAGADSDATSNPDARQD